MKIKTDMRFKIRRLAQHTRSLSMKELPIMKKWWGKLRFLLQQDRLERELFHSCMTLKNLAIVYEKMPMSTDFILEHLMDSSQALRTAYADILTAYRNGFHEEAFQSLYHQIPIPTAEKFSRILRRLDYIPPAELVAQMNAFEETLAAERKTKAMAKAERKSLITTLASTTTIFVVLLNFVVVVVFLDTLNILQQIY